ncbi:MAG TPA: PAS domain S-box protein, partial [Opitutaceae bacterium]|nr:PAS domain S-box protein [Opitutaceae bacterium]
IIREWIKTTFGIIAAVMVAVVFVAYLLARSLQKQISNPILSLAGTAKAISERRDYSLRAPKLDHAEIGLLTDAFNHMLAQIQEQNQSLRSNEAQLQTIIEHIGEGLIVCNLEGRLLHFNRAALEMHGFASIDECRCHFSDLARRFELSSLDGVILPIEQWPIACILRGELLHNVEVGVRRLSPAWQRTFEYGGTLVRNGANQPFMAVMTVSDITERKRVESVRSQLVAVVENSDDAIVTKTTEGIITSWNRGAETLFGYTVEEAVGRPMVMLFPPERVQEETEILAKMKRGENISHFETVRVRKDGKPLDVSISISPLRDGQGRIVGVSQIARDITERKLERVRLQFRAFFESLPGLYLVLTPDLKIMAVSDAYLKATMTTRDAILGRDLFDAFPDNPDDPHATGTSNLRASLDRVRQEGVTDTMAVQKYDVRRPDGVFEERFWSPVNSPVFGPDRRLEYIIHRVEDVTDFIRRKQQPAAAQGELQRRMERMEAEIFLSAQKVQLANQQLNAANQELEAFSYSVSHDLRAPLRHIDGFIGLLEKHAVGSLDDKGRRYLSVISEAARQMGRLIDDLLAFSRSGRTAMNPVEVDQDAMIAGIIRDGGFEKNGRSIEWRIAPLPRVRADSLLLRQVWFNLIDNAVKYSGKVPHPCIEIGCRKDEAAGAHEFFVRDNGVGFDMQYADKLFGVFQRLHAFTEFEGTGIGLANVRRIVVRHGGRTWAESRVGEGAVFYFSLPATESAPPADSLALSPTSSFS